ncbi:MAG TPA: undecaprenyl-diphosphate phosphatase [Candidatus Angelobacter sp.]|jgi:undecaprenyl-diphosphatase|nr:undecaprenyl-diphosphate phosphatase [Candidatus Angelobacter sp.]
MHDSLLSILLGIIEGLTEFLPVSSTAHLRIAEALLGIDLGNGFWKMYSIVIQLGAILCLPIYFRTRIARFLSTFPRGERGDRTALNHPLTLVIIAFFFTAIPALLLTKVIGKHLESLVVMGWSLLIGGIIMWVVDAMFGTPRRGGRFQTERMEEMTTPQAIWIGICQIASAVFPGTSRSMSTIAAGQLVGMSRPAALEFSFFLSMPTMAAATLYDLFRTFHPKHGAEALGRMPVNGLEWGVLTIGFVVSFFVALAVVAWFMNWVRQRGFVPFAIYRIAVGVAVLVWVVRMA